MDTSITNETLSDTERDELARSLEELTSNRNALISHWESMQHNTLRGVPCDPNDIQFYQQRLLLSASRLGLFVFDHPFLLKEFLVRD